LTDLAVSEIGLGTAGIARRLGRRTIEDIFDAALDEGITHFDTAPMYGLGQAESMLGRWLAGRRDQVTVTTKVGLLPPPAAPAAVLPGRLLRGPFRAGREDFSLPAVRASFERSLRRLRTDYVDLLLLHECSPSSVTEELLEFAAGCVSEGSARATGVATGTSETAAISKRWAPFPGVAQVPWVPGTDPPTLPAGGVLITHSSAGVALRAVGQARAEERRRWSDELGIDCDDGDVVAGLGLALARRDPASTSTLFATRHADRLRANCRQAAIHAEHPERLDRFERLLWAQLAAG
jgi:D-threo-aldose 1-dehydrogenase